MRIDLFRSESGVRAVVVDMTDLRSLWARVPPDIGRDDVGRDLAGAVGWWDDTRLRVDPTWLRGVADCTAGERAAQFDDLLESARRRGSVDDGAPDVLVHVEQSRVAVRLGDVGIACRRVPDLANFFAALGADVDHEPDASPASAKVRLCGRDLVLIEDARAHPSRAGHIDLLVDDVDDTYAELYGRGIEFVSRPASDEARGIRSAAFVDPEQNRYYLVAPLG